MRSLLRAGKVIGIRSHDADVFSAGYICPKGVALKDLHEDPDRLRTTLNKHDGLFVEVSWDEAFAEINHLALGGICGNLRIMCSKFQT